MNHIYIYIEQKLLYHIKGCEAIIYTKHYTWLLTFKHARKHMLFQRFVPIK